MKDSSKPTSPPIGGSASMNEIHDEEEALPLYQDIGSPAQLPLPSEDATPLDVRTFIYQTLVVRQGLDAADAREIASKWKLGGGRELRSYPPSVYTSIFGPEESWVIFRTVNLLVQEEKRPQRERRLRNLHIGFGTGVGSMLLVSFVLSSAVEFGWIFLAVFTVPAALVMWLIFWFEMSKTSEQLVEIKMQSFKTTDHTQSAPAVSGQPGMQRM